MQVVSAEVAEACAYPRAHVRLLAPMRAVVTPPHLPAKTSGFYAHMHGPPKAAQHGPRGEGRADSSMRS
ncbi:hypothetical protein F01_50170 [Burkholderia cenocepacia]|nr:hypothetical protein F01_50170 [Burkholderia cenocepacia]